MCIRDSLEAALGEQSREGRLGGARHADQHEIGLLEVARLLAAVSYTHLDVYKRQGLYKPCNTPSVR